MKAFIIERYGKKEIGRIADMSEPALQDDDVLVDIPAAAVNVLDIKIRSGEFKLILPYRMPAILGHDVAGKAKSKKGARAPCVSFQNQLWILARLTSF
ncbi:alcohol dehydrogenase catalytic domain-containing protein [Massilia dura]|uniref:Alcohol dehydrogenase catalytic domain-containing protein n=1 Tax=Pseudoduganella dura TaxID=321982 RepID=A0A6I3XQ03_9BURK|nr:alcohol dehydrogenase catalytic domain-containing protein [Pseudoduganella dura]GGX80428.1 hypothetical protein GCM10007386_09250 [Pseudoduganella dura]